MVKELQEAEIELEEAIMQIADLLEAALFFAGVKEEKIPDAVDAYIKALDALDEEDEGEDPEMGSEEVIQLINSLKLTHKHLFN